MFCLQRTARLVAALVAEVAAVVALAVVGRRPALAVPVDRLGPWLHSRPPADVLVALLRWVALGGALWLLASTVLYALAAAIRVPAAVRAVRWSALPVVRRTVDAAFAVTVVSSAALAPVAVAAGAPAATHDPPSVSLVRDGRGGAIAELPPDATAPSVPATTSTPETEQPVVPVAAAPGLPAPSDEVVVEPGDNLWELSARHLAAHTGRTRAHLADTEIAPYWLRVCDTNRARLRSGDPNLVHPGERVVLPPVS